MFIKFGGEVLLGGAILAIGFWLANLAYTAIQHAGSQNAAGLGRLASSIAKNATDLYADGSINPLGDPANYRVLAVDGNADLGPGTGYGILLVRGELSIVGDITWNGLIVAIGQGVVRSNAGCSVVRSRVACARVVPPARNLIHQHFVRGCRGACSIKIFDHGYSCLWN